MDQLTEPKLDSKSFSHHCAVIPLLSQFVIPISFQHHSNAISSSFQCRFSARDMRKVLRWNASKTEIVSFRCRLISERDGTMSGPRLTERSRSENRCPDWRSLNLTHNHSCIIARSFRYYPNSPFRCHSDIIPMSFHHRSGVVSVHEAWGNFWDGTNHKRKLLSFHSRLI